MAVKSNFKKPQAYRRGLKKSFGPDFYVCFKNFVLLTVRAAAETGRRGRFEFAVRAGVRKHVRARQFL